MEIEVREGDKLGHLAAYLALMSWFTNIHQERSTRVACAAACVALGVGLEFAQTLTATRTFDVYDMIAGAAGVLLAWLAAPPRLPNYLRLFEKVIGRRNT